MSFNVLQDRLRREQRRAVRKEYSLLISLVTLSSVFGLMIGLGR